MNTAFIFHGTDGYPEENWFPWLNEELTKRGYTVYVPQFPTPVNQTLEAWFDVFKEYATSIDQHTVMIGHSLGGAFLLRVLERIQTPIAVACLVATPIGIPPILNVEGDQPFTGHPFDWEKIRSHAKKFVVFQSDNDPYVSLGNGEEIARKLHTKLALIPGAGHFNAKAGYLRFPELLAKISPL